MDSEDEIQQTLPAKKGKKSDKEDLADKEIVLTKAPKKKKVPTQKQLDALNANRSKALQILTEQRRAKREKKEEAKKMVEEKILDNAPKVREIDSGFNALKAEMEALKKELAEAKKPNLPPPPPVERHESRTQGRAPPADYSQHEEKPKRRVKKVIYEDEDEDVEEIVEVVQRKSQTRPKPVTGTELLDKLFFTNRIG